ncbi:methyltransferase domain-containing protein [Desulfobacterales bacterium HSG2]|nr:methyltransferase domain-containing protein [Desulfobacterales bacterium HSG2]
MKKKNYQWNATDYADHSASQFEWAGELIDKLALRGNEVLLDIGCGDGKVSAAIAARLPDGHVLGIDSSGDMTELAARRYPDFPNLSFQTTDVRELDFENRFDVAFSNAALHWITDHLSFLPKIKKSLKCSGKILFQMGGRGNAQEILSVLDNLLEKEEWKPYFYGFRFPYGFYGPEEYEKWLPRVGLNAERIELIPKDMMHKGKKELAAWLRTTWLPYTERLPENLRESFISDVVDTYAETHPPDKDGVIHVGMARLEIEAYNI